MKEHLKDYIENSNTPEVRGLRILLEYFHATEIFEKIIRSGIKIVSVFGSARTQPNTAEYDLANKLGKLLYQAGFAVVTGASRGIMQAANQGVTDAIAEELVKKKLAPSADEARTMPQYLKLLKKHSVGLSISLPFETESNPFVGVNATFHYFMIRKFFFGTLSSGFIACEGGWGTRDELFEMLTLVQTGKAPVFPIVYLARDPRRLEQDLHDTLDKKYILPEDMNLIKIVRTPEQAVREMALFYRNVKHIHYERDCGIKILLKKPLSLKKKREVSAILHKSCSKSIPLEWRKNQLLIKDYLPRSYGTLRRAVNAMNTD